MASLLLSAVVAILSVPQISGQDFNYAFGNAALCNTTFADFNASGIFYINPNIQQVRQSGQPDNNSGKTLASGWATTIQNSYGTVNESSSLSATFSSWYNTNGADYSDDIALGYDVCAMAIAPLNYNAELRGLHDNGTCLSTMDQPCVDALKAFTQQHADWLTVGNTGPQLNLTNTSLPGICNDLGAALNANFPSECSYFFDEPTVLDGALTTWNNNYDTFLSDSCVLNNTNGTWHNILNFSTNSSLAGYTSWTRSTYPILTVFMPVANLAAGATISSSVTELTCLRVDTINDGSYVPPAAPEPTPINYAKNLGNPGGGAIAGIVIGVLAVVAILLLGTWWYGRKRGWRTPGWRKRDSYARHMADSSPRDLVEAPGDVERHELPAGMLKHELPAETAKHELSAGYSVEVAELADAGTRPYQDYKR